MAEKTTFTLNTIYLSSCLCCHPVQSKADRIREGKVNKIILLDSFNLCKGKIRGLKTHYHESEASTI